ncbi:MAG: pyruvate kinase [Nitrospiraceae bacterium]|nr:pyruvate kinase [Nitrospiraceae bacterium]
MRQNLLKKRKAGIICTIGPASADREVLFRLIRCGMDIARLNFSHGSYAFHRKMVRTLRQGSVSQGIPVSIMQDLQGIKLRLGPMKNGGVELKKGSDVRIRPGEGMGDEKDLYVSYPLLLKDARSGDRILLDDGLVELRVTGRTREGLAALVIEGGVVRDRKGVNLPGMKISMQPFTDKDRRDLEFGLSMKVDCVALSFVRSASDIRIVKNWMKKKGRHIPVIAKIEKPEALAAIDEIIDEADGIMIARGDLGVEVYPEEVPLIQKDLIEKANRRGRLVITATQMLESMREHLRPTRAEATDIANAVIDGSDALMLSAETASGMHPVEAFRMMDRIIRYTEQKRHTLSAYEGGPTYADALADGACRAAEDIGAKVVACFTRTGFTARILSKLRPAVPIVAFTPDKATLSCLPLYWGVTPKYMRPADTIDRLTAAIERDLLRSKIAGKGDRVVIIAGSPLPAGAKTNFMKLHTIRGISASAGGQ